MAPVAAATSEKSSGATKSARARPSLQSIEWPGPAMKPSSDIHLFTTTLPLISQPPSLGRHCTSGPSGADTRRISARAATGSDLCADRGVREVPLQYVSCDAEGRSSSDTYNT